MCLAGALLKGDDGGRWESNTDVDADAEASVERERGGREGSGDDGGDVGMGWDGMGLWIWMESITVTADYPCLSLPNPLPGLFSFFIFNIVTDQTGYVILR